MTTRVRVASATLSAALLALLTASSCAGRKMVLELSGSVMYEKPRITAISHTLTDSRLDGGPVLLHVTLTGDPGLRATFDVGPDIAHSEPMREVEAGRYEGEYTFPSDLVGGPFTLLGRLRHDLAGEVILRDPASITIPISPRRR